MESPKHPLIAYPVGFIDGWEVNLCHQRRQWMNATPGEIAYRCLPLTMANQAGWVITCPVAFKAVWTSQEESPDSIRFTFDEACSEGHKRQIRSHFGSGIITFTIPYLFRTIDGTSLLVRGLPNEAKPHCAPLEGLVETDWNIATFTMNWRILTPHVEISFEKGEPICFIQPVSLDLMEAMVPEIKSLESSPETQEAFKAWSASRASFNASPDRGGDWQKHYHKGVDMKGEKRENHRTRVRLSAFKKTL